MASVPPLLLIGTGLILLGNLLHIIGLATPHWEEVDLPGSTDGSWGLFKACIGDTCNTYDDPSSEREATQAMIIIGMLCAILAGVAALGYVVLNLLSKSAPKMTTIVCIAGCVAAFIFIIIGVIVYGSEIHVPDNDLVSLGYSFGLCITAAILLAVGGGLVAVGAKAVG